MTPDQHRAAVARVSPTHRERTARSYENGEAETGTARNSQYDWRHEGHGKR